MPQPQDTEFGDFQLLPADDPDIEAAAELDQLVLDPEGDPLVDAEFAPPPKIPYGKGWLFDINAGRLSQYGQRPVSICGKDSLRQWISFIHQIQAGAHSIIPPGYGLEDPFRVIGQEYSPALESEYEEDVQRALLMHDRVVGVSEFTFTHSDDETIENVEYVVVTDDGEEIDVSEPVATRG